MVVQYGPRQIPWWTTASMHVSAAVTWSANRRSVFSHSARSERYLRAAAGTALGRRRGRRGGVAAEPPDSPDRLGEHSTHSLKCCLICGEINHSPKVDTTQLSKHALSVEDSWVVQFSTRSWAQGEGSVWSLCDPHVNSFRCCA